MNHDPSRRRLASALTIGSASLALGACKKSQSTTSKGRFEPVRWKMATAWPRDFPGLGEGANFLAQAITQMSGGRIQVKVYGSGELVPPFEVFDAVSQGTVQMGHAAAYYWKGKVPEAQFFGAVPFGMNAQETNAWLYEGGGLSLWQELYAPFNLIPLPAGQTGVQMGGWFNREIRSIDDIQGLVMRIPGLGGEVLKRAGGSPKALPGAELFTALQTGNIDATEWVGPYNDLAFGLHQAAKYYYYPGWHEPTACLECLVNKQAFDALPEDLQAIVRLATRATNAQLLDNLTARNQSALDTLINKHQVQLRRFPDDVLTEFKRHARAVVAELGQISPMAQRIYTSYRDFATAAGRWMITSEQAYFDARNVSADT